MCANLAELMDLNCKTFDQIKKKKKSQSHTFLSMQALAYSKRCSGLSKAVLGPNLSSMPRLRSMTKPNLRMKMRTRERIIPWEEAIQMRSARFLAGVEEISYLTLLNATPTANTLCIARLDIHIVLCPAVVEFPDRFPHIRCVLSFNSDFFHLTRRLTGRPPLHQS